jgi:hypothetical protein
MTAPLWLSALAAQTERVLKTPLRLLPPCGRATWQRCRYCGRRIGHGSKPNLSGVCQRSGCRARGYRERRRKT